MKISIFLWNYSSWTIHFKQPWYKNNFKNSDKKGKDFFKRADDILFNVLLETKRIRRYILSSVDFPLTLHFKIRHY